MIATFKAAVWRSIRHRVSASPRLRAWLRHALGSEEPFFASGHFYSPVVDRREATAQADALWPEPPADILGIDFDPEGHQQIIDNVIHPFLAGFDYFDPTARADAPLAFPPDNDQFGGADALMLYCFMRHYAPKRIIEIGSGYSTLLMRDVNRRFLGGAVRIECVEPYPRAFLRDPVIGVELRVAPAQAVPLDVFSELAAGDILFIDSSHVSKTGSDVNHIFFEILPRLANGVVIHVHDIFLPQEYPRDWVFDGRRSWNEQYLLRALLMGSSEYRVLYAVHYANLHFADRLNNLIDNSVLPQRAGSSFWLRKDAGRIADAP